MDRNQATAQRDTDTPGSGDQPVEDTNVPVVPGPGKEPERQHGRPSDESDKRREAHDG